MTDQRVGLSFGAFVLARPKLGGLIGALIFYWFSTTPTLLPRAMVMQAAVTGLSIAIGYGLGSAIEWLVVAVRADRRRRPNLRTWLVISGLCVAVPVVGSWRWLATQNEQRALVGLAEQSLLNAILWPVLAIGLAVILVLVARVIGFGVVALDRFLHRWLTPRVAHVITAAALALLSVFLVQDVVVSGFLDWANDRYGSGDLSSPPGVSQPTSPLVSGSPESLVPWETIGYQGRAAMAGASSADDIAAFHGDDRVSEPIRVYVGLASAETEAERAELAVAELDRTGAFDREYLMVATVTGTGWLDPAAAAAFEYLYRGDTAIVAIQYSYLPSWISFITDKDKAARTGVALHAAVEEHLATLPESQRPRLVVFGESLGTYGSEAAFAGSDIDASVDAVTSRTDAVVWVGPTDANQVLSQLRSARDADTPVWRPAYGGGETIVSVNLPGEADPTDLAWRQPRALYHHHPSDPVGYWNWETLWMPQEWSMDPVGYDVSPRTGWFPIVTWVQVLVDLMAGFSTDPGFGHNYADVFVDVFAAVLPPEGWNDADTDRLQSWLEQLGQ